MTSSDTQIHGIPLKVCVIYVMFVSTSCPSLLQLCLLVPNLKHLQLCLWKTSRGQSRLKHTTYCTLTPHNKNITRVHFIFSTMFLYYSSQMSNNMVNCKFNRRFLFSFFLIRHTSGSWEQVDTDRCCNLHWETCLGFISGHCCKWLWQPAHKLCLPPVPHALMKPDNIWTNETGSSLLWSTHKFGERLNMWPNSGWEPCVVELFFRSRDLKRYIIKNKLTYKAMKLNNWNVK